MEKIMEVISEYWFFDHYRVLVIKEPNNKYIVSVDVYRKGWNFEVNEEVCVSQNRYCLIYCTIDPSKHNIVDGIAKIVITGIKTNHGLETVDVRYIMNRSPTYSDIEKMFYYSWKLIGCEGPKDSAWDTRCD